MPPAEPTGRIYSATYSNVPVYEYNVAGTHVMRRRADDWINATHILKVADFDKPARTRILEREVQKGVHEKVQGGYGKYQGTWVPLQEGRMLAERNGVLDKLRPIFDFIPGDRSPPPAPKHATAASNRPKAPRSSAAALRNNGKAVRAPPPAATAPAPPPPFIAASQQSQVSEDHFEEVPRQRYVREETPDNDTIVSESMVGDPDMMHPSQYSAGGGSRKRKRGIDQMSIQDQQHQIWADALLDYFMLLDSEDQFVAPPEPPPNVNLDRPIDDKGHSAMHWAAAMGDVEVVKELSRRGARLESLSNNLETPLMRAVMFTNNYDKQTMPAMVKIFQSTVHRTDCFGRTVFHHIATTTSSANKFVCARYYLDCIINKLLESWIPDEVTRILNAQDQYGDTAIMIAARNGARKCVRSLLGRNVSVDIPNKKGETADDLIRELNQRRRLHGRATGRAASSSPFAPPPDHRINGYAHHTSRHASLVPNLPFPSSLSTTSQNPSTQFRSQTASHVMNKIAPSILEKCEQLALAYEAEVDEKDAEALDAERVVKKRQAEIEAVRKEMAELTSLNSRLLPQFNAGSEDETDRVQEEELRSLVDEAESLLEIEQRMLLRNECAAIQMQNLPDSEDTLPEKFRLALLLYRAQSERRQLVKEVVANLSVAGMGERQTEYKKLITTALGVKEEDVEGMLPEILAELEEAKERERVEGLEASPL